MKSRPIFPLTIPQRSFLAATISLAAFLWSAAAGAAVSYRNDFATRTSSGAIPETGVWHSATPYPTANNEIYA